MKQCSTCKTHKTLDNFHRRTGTLDGLQYMCKSCNIARVEKWYRNNPEKRTLLHQRNGRRRRLISYGLTETKYTELYDSQHGKCLICHKWSSVLSVDHDHTSGKVRGLLCRSCNLVLGMMCDDPILLRKAADYLISRM